MTYIAPSRIAGPALKLKTGPTVSPLTLGEAKGWCRVDPDDHEDDVMIQALIDGYTGYLEKILGRAFIEQEWYLYYDEFPSAELQIPFGDVISVTAVEYLDGEPLVYTAWPNTNYTVDIVQNDGWINFVTAWPTEAAEQSNAVRITYKAGFGSGAASVPQALRNAIGMLVTMGYDDPMGVDYKQPLDGLPMPVQSMISPYRRIYV